MKIKKVEIQGFRAYRDAKDSTYNFMLSDGQCADFISIYAPNGFGKTSFYDAVEWGMTNNISRLLKREKENAVVAKEERKKDLGPNGEKKKQFILRNRDFGETNNAYVRIETTLQGEDYSPTRQIPEVSKRGGTDFGFNEKDTLKKMTFFRDVILSQDWIDAFLREDTAEDRYQKFMDYFVDKEIDIYYKYLVSLMKENQNQIDKIKERITELSKIPFEAADNKIIETTNSQIETLISLGENLNKIDIYFNEQIKRDLEKTINNRVIEANNHIEELTSLSKEINGHESKIDLHFERKKQQDSIFSEINLLKESQKRIKEKDSLTNQINNLRSDIEKINDQKKYIYEILRIYPVYQQVKERIIEENKNRTEYISSLEVKNAEAETIKNNIHNQQKEIKKLNDSNINIEALIGDIPNIYTKIRSLNAEIKEKLDEKNLLEKGKLQEYLLLSTKHESLKEIIKQNLSFFDSGSFAGIEGLSEEKRKNILQIELVIREIEISSNLIKDYEKKITDEIRIQKDVKSLIREGTEIIEKSQSEFCPLCHTKYESFLDLLNRISQNPILSEKESILLKSKSLEEVRLKANKDLLDDLKNKIKNEILEKQRQLDLDILRNTKDINSIKQAILSLENTITDKVTELEIYTKKTESLDEVELLLKLKNQKKKNIAEIQVEKNKLASENETQTLLNNKIQALTTKNKTSADIILSVKENPEYNKVLEFSNIYFIEDISLEQIQDLINKESDKIKQIETQITEYNVTINRLNELLLPVKVSEIESNITNKESQLELILGSLAGFNGFMNKISIPKEDIENKEQVIGFMRKMYSDNQKRISHQKNIIEEYQKLEKSKEYILPYLKQRKIKEDTLLAENSLRKQSSLKKDLEKERQGLATHIQTHINSFFHKELIVDIYSKIDPHPDYKEIDFTCNFDDVSPKLTVFVKTQGQQGKYISPSLYFSAAQLNVLSLSIFLAKALNATDDKDRAIDCIFLDDPIQSMDSINILSTIDLLRSLVINHKKQLILSTHEENFHLLLQKKIPRNLFRSKYIELETFGKIKQDN